MLVELKHLSLYASPISSSYFFVVKPTGDAEYERPDSCFPSRRLKRQDYETGVLYHTKETVSQHYFIGQLLEHNMKDLEVHLNQMAAWQSLSETQRTFSTA